MHHLLGVGTTVDVYDGGETVHLGGGSINVARVLSNLNVPARLYLLIGQREQHLLTQLNGAPYEVVRGDFNTRTIEYGLTGTTCGAHPEVQTSELERLVGMMDSQSSPGDFHILTGSVPSIRGYADEAQAGFYADLIARAKDSGIRTLVDAREPWLGPAIERGPYCLKVNEIEIAEAAQSYGWDVFPIGPDDESEGDRSYRHAYQQGYLSSLMDARGIEYMVLTRAADGLLLITHEQAVTVRPPVITHVHEVGAGDSALAGIARGLHEGWDPQRMARYAATCGMVSAGKEGTLLCERDEVEAAFDRVTDVDVVDRYQQQSA